MEKILNMTASGTVHNNNVLKLREQLTSTRAEWPKDEIVFLETANYLLTLRNVFIRRPVRRFP